MAGRFKRVNQWLLFARQWHVIDANCQVSSGKINFYKKKFLGYQQTNNKSR